MAGSEHGSAKTVAELVAIAEGIGRPAGQRTTTYAKRAAEPVRVVDFYMRRLVSVTARQRPRAWV